MTSPHSKNPQFNCLMKSRIDIKKTVTTLKNLVDLSTSSYLLENTSSPKKIVTETIERKIE